MNKLTTTGQWTWRENEIGLNSFNKLTRKEKEEHINFLINLEKENLSINDQYILRQYGPVGFLEEEKKNSFTLKEEMDFE